MRQLDRRRTSFVLARTRVQTRFVGVWLVCARLLSDAALADEARLSTDTFQSTVGLAQHAAFVSPGRFLWDHVLAPVVARGKRLALERPLDLPRRARVTRSHRPLRQITFVGGDRVSAELLHWGTDSVKVRLAGGQVVVVPQISIAAISIPPGEVELIDESFEADAPLSGHVEETAREHMTIDSNHAASGQRALQLSSDTLPLTVTSPVTTPAARVQFWFRTERSASAITDGRMSFHFGPPSDAINAANTLALQLDGTRLAVVERPQLPARWTTQTVELAPGWHCLTAVCAPLHVLCFVDEALLASSSGIDVPLRSIRFAARTHLWIDDLLVSQLDNEPPVLIGHSRDEYDVVVTHSGDEYFGRLDRLEPRSIALAGIASELTLPWSRIAGLSFRRTDQPVRGLLNPLAGIVARLDWQPFVDRPQLAADRLAVTIIAMNHETLLVAHPWLGEFLIPWRDVRRLEPLFVGRTQVLDARRVHLGDALRADFHRPLADGTTWRCEFDLNAEPFDNAWLSLDAADLEPSGPDTPVSSPFLKTLRAGRLVTEVFVNGQRAGDLNRLVRFKASPDKPARLRCPLPREALRSRANILELRQRPLTENGSDYDDCELSNVRIERHAR